MIPRRGDAMIAAGLRGTRRVPGGRHAAVHGVERRVEVFGSIDSRGGDLALVKLPPELAGAGLSAQVVWSGDQVLIFVADGGRVRVAPLPCA
jgi:hypothetical protein